MTKLQLAFAAVAGCVGATAMYFGYSANNEVTFFSGMAGLGASAMGATAALSKLGRPNVF